MCAQERERGARRIGEVFDLSPIEVERLTPGEMKISGPGVRIPGAHLPLSISVGLDGDLEGWTATWTWVLVDADGEPFDILERTDEVTPEIVLGAPVTLTPPGPVRLTDAAQSRVYRSLKVPWMPKKVRERALSVGSVIAAWGRAAEHPGRRPGRGRTPDAEYVMWVLRRIEAEKHAPKRPVAWLAEQYGRRDPQSVQNYLSRAKNRKLATSPPWRLTAKGERVRAQAERIDRGDA